MKIISGGVTRSELQNMAGAGFGNLVKAVVDVARELLAVDAELHSDLETLLLEDGSQQIDLWGINLYPAQAGDDFIEFDSLINIRPGQGNPGRGVESPELQKLIRKIVLKQVSS